MQPWRWVLSCVTCPNLQITYINYNRFIAAIILSEKQCQEQLKEVNKTCEGEFGSWPGGDGLVGGVCGEGEREGGQSHTAGVGEHHAAQKSSWAHPRLPPPPALLFKLGEKVKTLEMEVAKEKAVCSKDKESLLAGKRQTEEQLEACGKARERQQQEQQVTEENLRKVQSLCIPLDQEKFQADVLSAWRDSLIYRTLETLPYHYQLMPEYASLRRTCESLPGIMTTKIEELARGLRAGIERVTRENAELRRQKLELERAAQAAQEARARAGTEAQARETQLRAECARQTQLALEEKAALRAQRDNLERELEARKRELEQLRTEVDVRISALDTCVKAKVGLPRRWGPVPRIQPGVLGRSTWW